MSGTSKSYGVGILGNCCTHGEFVAAAIQQEPEARIVAAWEESPQRQQGLSKAVGIELEESADKLLENPDIEILAVSCSPHEKADWIEKAAAAGKHIFLNKPMCESLDSARRIEKTVRDTGVQLVHDISVIRFDPLTAKLLDEVRNGVFGKPISYAHIWGMTFSTDFPLPTVWAERLDPPWRSGGGEMTNMGCYAIDYMVAMWGQPRTVQAKSNNYWKIYKNAGVENFGQVIADYGSFFALLSTGKQPLATLPSMDVDEALNSRNWHNVLEMQFETHNLTVMPFHGTIIRNGTTIPTDSYLDDYQSVSSFKQLIRAIETSKPPDSNAESARMGVEVLMAAYKSIKEGGIAVPLPLEEGKNPLVG